MTSVAFALQNPTNFHFNPPLDSLLCIMEDNQHQEWKQYPSFPSKDAAKTQDGDYVVRPKGKADVSADGPKVETKVWFRSPPLDAATIKRINRVQLHTKSCDQGDCSDRAAGTWTWFEIAIMADERAESPRIKDGIRLTWLSHVNVQGQKELEELTGQEFKTGDDMLGALEQGNVLAVKICAQFADWALYAEEGYLTIRLGHPTQHRSVDFGNVASNMKGYQEAMADLNQIANPGKQTRLLPDTVLNASYVNTKDNRPLRVLVIDGGGVRGLAALHILQKIMIKAYGDSYEENLENLPCNVFDMICGTSTGGLIAIMLGRMRMKVSECITEYEKFMNDVFPRGVLDNKYMLSVRILGRLWSSMRSVRDTFTEIWKGEKWASDELEECIKKVMEKYMNPSNPVDPEKVLLKNDDKEACKVFVTATRRENGNNTAPVLLRSYINPVEEPELAKILLWQAARATSAAPLYFKHVTVKGVDLVDGGLQANNPLGWAWNEVLTTFGPARTTGCFLSIGTGAAKSVALPTIGLNMTLANIKTAFIDALSALTTNTEITNVLFRSLINNFSPQTGIRKYWRFNVGDGWVDLVKKDESWVWEGDSTDPTAVDIEMDDSSMGKKIADDAIAYMNADGPIQLQKLKECAAALLDPTLEDDHARSLATAPIPTSPSLPTPPPDKILFELGPR